MNRFLRSVADALWRWSIGTWLTLFTMVSVSVIGVTTISAWAGGAQAAPTVSNPFLALQHQKLAQPLAELGRQIFFDTKLSEPAGTSCASCHDPARAFSGDNGSGIGVAAGSLPGALGVRNSPGLTYLARVPGLGLEMVDGKAERVGGLFWDGRANTLEEQAAGPLFTANEMNNSDRAEFARKIAAAPYAALAKEIFGADLLQRPDEVLTAVTTSLGAFQRHAVFAPFSSKFDAVLRGDAKFTVQEERGLTLFTIAQKGNCHHCHVVDLDSKDPNESLFTNFRYHALGVPRNVALPRNEDPAHFDLGLCQTLRERDVVDADAHCGFFRVPSLRNVALTAPYMHNGQFKTLTDAVAFYATRDTNPERWYPQADNPFNDLPEAMAGNVDRKTRPYHRKRGKRAALSAEEVDDIVVFLHTLTDGYTR